MIGFGPEGAPLATALAELTSVTRSAEPAASALAAVRGSGSEYALLFLDRDPDGILELTRQIAQQTPCIPLVVSADRHPDTILRAMRAGARDFAYLEGDGVDVLRAVRELLAKRAPAPAARGKVIAAFSCKGGSGATTLALNLAASLLTPGDGQAHHVLVLDIDAERGDALTYLDLPSRYGFRELLANMHRLDTEMVRAHSLVTHGSGLRVLAHTEEPAEVHWLETEEFTRVLAFLRQHFEFVVIDGLRDFRALSLAALDAADAVLCTMTQDVPSLKNAGRCEKVFSALGYREDKVKLVVNRYRNGGSLTTDAIADALGRRVDGTVSNDFPAVVKAINEGRLLVEKDPGSKVSRDVRALVPLFHESTAPKRRSLFGRWGK